MFTMLLEGDKKMIWLLVGCVIGFGIITFVYGDVFLIKRLRHRDKPKQETELHKYIFKDPIKLETKLVTPESQKTWMGYYKGVAFAKKKAEDLQLLLDKNSTGATQLHPNDVIRYRAMVEVLKQVVEIGKSG